MSRCWFSYAASAVLPLGAHPHTSSMEPYSHALCPRLSPRCMSLHYPKCEAREIKSTAPLYDFKYSSTTRYSRYRVDRRPSSRNIEGRRNNNFASQCAYATLQRTRWWGAKSSRLKPKPIFCQGPPRACHRPLYGTGHLPARMMEVSCNSHSRNPRAWRFQTSEAISSWYESDAWRSPPELTPRASVGAGNHGALTRYG